MVNDSNRTEIGSENRGRPVGPPLHRERRVVRFQDVDAAGIVFYGRIFDYFHDAYVAFLRDRGAPLEDALRDRSWVAPLRHAEADYLRPLRFGDAVDVLITQVRVEGTEYQVRYRIEKEGELACVGETLHVTVDPETFVRTPVPEILQKALTEDPPGHVSGPGRG